MADADFCAGALPGAKGPGLSAPLLLIAVGSLIATTVALSKLAADAGAPMLSYLAAVWTGAGLLLGLPVALRRGLAGLGGLLPYSLGAGTLMVAPSAMGYLAVSHVGAGFVSLTFAFPVLLTWLIARIIGMREVCKGQGAGVLAGLAGGLVLAAGKLAETGGPTGGAAWVLTASAIPFALAFGNIFRTRYWPPGEAPLTLAALSVLTGAALIVPAAAMSEAGTVARLWNDPALCTLVLAGAATVAAQFMLQFRLQVLAGPVYLSQIGGVAAMVGAVISVVLLNEALPPAFRLSAPLVIAGTVLFHRASRAGPTS